jgi:hypothetical protein
MHEPVRCLCHPGACTSSPEVGPCITRYLFVHVGSAPAMLCVPPCACGCLCLTCRLPGEGLGEQVQKRLGGLLTGFNGEPSTLS